MTDIIALAREAGFFISDEGASMVLEKLQRFADLVRQDQREKDAAICSAQGKEYPWQTMADACAAAIRSQPPTSPDTPA